MKSAVGILVVGLLRAILSALLAWLAWIVWHAGLGMFSLIGMIAFFICCFGVITAVIAALVGAASAPRIDQAG